MSEAELWELFGEFNSIALTAMALYLTSVSSFLIAAYLVARNLTRYQVSVVTGLFLIFACLFTWGTVGYFLRALYFVTQLREITDADFWMTPVTPYVVGSVEIIGVFVCLIFMWQVRHPKTE